MKLRLPKRRNLAKLRFESVNFILTGVEEDETKLATVSENEHVLSIKRKFEKSHWCLSNQTSDLIHIGSLFIFSLICFAFWSFKESTLKG